MSGAGVERLNAKKSSEDWKVNLLMLEINCQSSEEQPDYRYRRPASLSYRYEPLEAVAGRP